MHRLRHVVCMVLGRVGGRRGCLGAYEASDVTTSAARVVTYPVTPRVAHRLFVPSTSGNTESPLALHTGRVHQTLLLPCTPIIPTGPCPSTGAGPYAAWMPHKSLHGRIHGVSRAGGRARALQPGRRSHAWLWCPLRLRRCLIHTAFFKPGRLPLAAGVQCAVKPTASPTPMPHTPTPAWSSAQRACYFKGLSRMHPWKPRCRRWCRLNAPHAVRTPPRKLQIHVPHAAANNSNAGLLAVQRPDQERSATAVSLTNARSSTLTSSV